MEKKYTGTKTGESGGFDGFAGLVLGAVYQGEEQEVLVEQKQVEGQEPVPPVLTKRVFITLPNGRPTSVSVEQWDKWFVRA